MLFCPSFTQSERFLQTDLLIIRLQVVVVTNFRRMLMRNVFVNVFKSDAVIWWAAILAHFEVEDGRKFWFGCVKIAGFYNVLSVSVVRVCGGCHGVK